MSSFSIFSVSLLNKSSSLVFWNYLYHIKFILLATLAIILECAPHFTGSLGHNNMIVIIQTGRGNLHSHNSRYVPFVGAPSPGTLALKYHKIAEEDPENLAGNTFVKVSQR